MTERMIIEKELTQMKANVSSKDKGRSIFLNMQGKDAREDKWYLKNRFNEIRRSTKGIHEAIQEYLNYCKAKKLHVDKSAISAAKKIVSEIIKILNRAEDIDLDPRLPATDYGERITDLLQKYRALLHAVLSASLIIDWRSPSYDQSVDTMFFALDCQSSAQINYNRYRSIRLTKIENHLINIFCLNKTQNDLLMTSSGMAAYNLIENYLLRYVLKPGDTIYLPHYIYFETYEQISRLPMIKIEKSNTYDASHISEFILKNKPRVVFLDPITNTVELRMINIEMVIEQLETHGLGEEIHIIIDGSMMAGELLPFPRPKNEKIRILYYESCTKYLQLGLDIFMGGLVVVPAGISKIVRRLRTNTGTIMYDNVANIFPIYRRTILKQRMRRFARNALLIGKVLEKDKILSRAIQVHYPTLESHPDCALAKKYNSTGAVLTFTFNSPALNQRNLLNKFIDAALSISKKRGVSLIKGLSFGFSLPRIFASSARPENNDAPPYLRLSVGDRSYCETISLAIVLLETFKIHLSSIDD